MELPQKTSYRNRKAVLLKLQTAGFSLFFEGHIPALAQQIQELSLDPTVSPPPRISLLFALLQPGTELQLEEFYPFFLGKKDLEACCACVGGAIARIWENGVNLSHYSSWLERADILLEHKTDIPILAKSYLLLQKGAAEMSGSGDLVAANKNYSQQRLLAQEAGSISLQLIGAAAHAYCFTWSGNLAKAEMLLLETAPYMTDPLINPLCLMHHQTTFAMVKTIQGNPQHAASLLNGILAHPLFDQAPQVLQLLTLNHLLETQIAANHLTEVEQIAARIRNLTIPKQNNFHHAYLNFCLGMAALVSGRPHKAKLYADEAANRAQISHSAIATRMTALLQGQVLVDLGDNQGALQHFEVWDKHWQNAGYHLISTFAELEVSVLYLRQGLTDVARMHWDRAHDLLPAGEPMNCIYRSNTYYTELRKRLFLTSDTNPKGCQHQVNIATLGEFSLEINGQKLYDRNWRGRQSKNLLKALICHGGQKVSTEKIAALIWPDAEGDLATNSLNVTLTRLRKVGVKNGQKPIPWLASQQRKLSLIKRLCCVDALVFRDRIKTALAAPLKPELLQPALDLYTGNFLPADTQFGWVDMFREELLQLFVRGVLHLVDKQTRENHISGTITLLEKALSYDPVNEILYWELMQAYLNQSNHGKALETYNRAVKTLDCLLNTSPGSALTTLARKIRTQD